MFRACLAILTTVILVPRGYARDGLAKKMALGISLAEISSRQRGYEGTVHDDDYGVLHDLILLCLLADRP